MARWEVMMSELAFFFFVFSLSSGDARLTKSQVRAYVPGFLRLLLPIDVGSKRHLLGSCA